MAQNNRPVTPPLQREPSFEDINIFADGDTASSLRERERGNGNVNGSGIGLAPPRMPNMRDSHQTTFSDMMERSGLAGLQKGQRKSSPSHPLIPTRALLIYHHSVRVQTRISRIYTTEMMKVYLVI